MEQNNHLSHSEEESKTPYRPNIKTIYIIVGICIVVITLLVIIQLRRSSASHFAPDDPSQAYSSPNITTIEKTLTTINSLQNSETLLDNQEKNLLQE